jgi:translation initiation factor IF-2
MQQRRVRLGDVLDDYCPRERRITNHAVVAMIDDEVKQTRCATCDAEHEYKAAKVPAPRRKKPGGALSTELPDTAVRPRPPVAAAAPALDEDAAPTGPPRGPEEPAPAPDADLLSAAPQDAAPAPQEDTDSAHEHEHTLPQDDWVHRPLIRATLPRQEGQVPERKAPDFTMRQTNGRFDNRNGQRPRGPRTNKPGQGQFRQAQGQPSGSRFGGQGPRQGSGPGARHGQGPGHVPRHGGGQPGNRPGSPPGQRGGNRPGGPPRGPRQGSGGGRKRGR